MSDLMKFEFQKKEVRVALDEQGEPWWVAKDVCDILDLVNPTEACRSLDEDEKGLRKIETLQGSQDMITISESGLYTLIIRSNKPQARKFRRWVTHEVLPSIRKTGAYGVVSNERLIDMARRYEQIARIFAAMKHMARTAGLIGKNAVALANELTLSQTGFDCLEFLQIEAEYVPEEAHIGYWFGECCVADAGGFAFSRDLYGSYRQWCAGHDVQPLNMGAFIVGVKESAPQLVSWRWKRRGGHLKGLKGIRLK